MSGYTSSDETLSSLSYQILLVFGSWYFLVYAVAEFILIIFKGLVFPYPAGNFTSEMVLLFFLCGVEYIRSFLGKKGNLTERILPVALSVILTVPVVIGDAYFMWWQTWVLRIDVIISVILIVFHGLQSIFAGFSLITFARASVK